MAVKHKVVECVETKADVRLTILLRALQSINSQHGLQVTEVGKICEKIVYSLGTLPLPSDMEEYLRFMENIESVQEILANTCCSNEDLIFTTLKAFYNDISNPEKQVQPTMSVVLQLINPEYIPTAVKWIIHSGYSEQNLEQALKTLCNWLSCWTLTPNLGVLVLHFMRGLEMEQHYDILVEVTMTYIERLFKLLILPDHRKNVGPVVCHMLSKVQHSPKAFLKILPHVNTVVHLLNKESTESSLTYLQNIVNLCVALMEHFPGHSNLYGPVRRCMEPFCPTVNYLETLNCKSWSDGLDRTITFQYSKGKVGLNNLGNTCYMNSVLQALFMTKMFRNDVLTSSKDAVPLLSKLQVLFALLQHSRRTSLSPADILTLARPPGFQPGHQHDSSEFLGYLLDVLHEQEKTIYTASQGDAASAVNETVVQNSFGGRTITVSMCGKCGTKSERADHFRELQLSFPSNNDNTSVQTLLDYYLQPEPLCGDNQYHCDTCRGLTDGERVTIIAEPPPRLVLTLKHFRYDPVSQQRTKLLQRVKLDAFVQIGEQYELYAAVVHCGSSVDSGHYYTIAKDEQVWYKFNDCAVIQTTEEELCGLRPPETPYILFYSRRNCSDPDNLPRASLSARLESELVRDNAELETERMRRQIKTYATRQNKNDEPPPPGCGGGGMLDNFVNRYVF